MTPKETRNTEVISLVKKAFGALLVLSIAPSLILILLPPMPIHLVLINGLFVTAIAITLCILAAFISWLFTSK